MEKTVKECYQEVKRFDESDLYQSDVYEDIALRRRLLRGLIEETFGPDVKVMLAELLGILAEETELECQHFFAQGYEAGQQA